MEEMIRGHDLSCNVCNNNLDQEKKLLLTLRVITIFVANAHVIFLLIRMPKSCALFAASKRTRANWRYIIFGCQYLRCK